MDEVPLYPLSGHGVIFNPKKVEGPYVCPMQEGLQVLGTYALQGYLAHKKTPPPGTLQ